jgi:hypothetical protein
MLFKSRIGAAKSCFETAWELQAVFLEPHEMHTNCQESLEQPFAAPMQFQKLLKTIARGLSKIYESL